MKSDEIIYPEPLLELIVSNIPDQMMKVFIHIVKHANEGGVTWTDLVEEFQLRSPIEKALFLFETNGFIFVSSKAEFDKRAKKYLPHNIRGMQLAQYISKKKKEDQQQ